ncbi:MAG TPA: DUF1365 domain-containing protein [Aquihabitans sp.]|nr:DUF1365 domain-containing protein [Aquihabitans sp.]
MTDLLTTPVVPDTATAATTRQVAPGPAAGTSLDAVDPGTGLRSAIYEGTLSHRRPGPVPHAFRTDVVMAWLALEELPHALDGHPLWSARRPAPVRYRRADFHGPAAVPLEAAVRDTVAAATGARPEGPIRLLAGLRTWGWSFNPIAFYFVLTPDRTAVEALVAEVTNTPWHERHAYVLPVGAPTPAAPLRFAKALHVSPFLDLDLDHELSFSAPGGSRLTIAMDDRRGEDLVFAARLRLDRRPLDRSTMGEVLRRHPVPAQRVSAGIYRQALALARKGAPFRRHPRHTDPDHPSPRSARSTS